MHIHKELFTTDGYLGLGLFSFIWISDPWPPTASAVTMMRLLWSRLIDRRRCGRAFALLGLYRTGKALDVSLTSPVSTSTGGSFWDGSVAFDVRP